ncbi:MAG: cyclopropane-fatty-acyl-phospholipid synthase family protein [Rhodospirillales bacterium]
MRTVLDSILTRLIRYGCLAVSWPDGTRRVYAGAPGPAAELRVEHPDWVRRLALDPAMVFGEAYMEGALQPVGCDIYDVLDVLLLNTSQGASHPVVRLHQRLRDLGQWLGRLTGRGPERHEVAYHYDLDSRLYSLFLDEDQQYSCAYFRRGDESLEEAQREKKRHIAAKLLLNRPGLTVLDIGCGWGGLALTLAQDFGARVTGITLSTEQLNLARARAEAAGLSDLVRFELADYRSIDARYDRIVSVGMLEHVGNANYGAFFGMVQRCLEPDGVALIHHIGRAAGPGSTSPWLRKYIFPGGYSPALSDVLPDIERSGLMTTDIEVLRLHYARTLRLWRERFALHRDTIRDLYDERFCRMFEFYLAGAELTFRHERHVVFQVQLSPSQTSLPFTRDYMMAEPGPNPRIIQTAQAL